MPSYSYVSFAITPASDVQLPALSLHDALPISRTGVLGNQATFLDAKLQFQQGRNSAANVLASALEGQRRISLQNFQRSEEHTSELESCPHLVCRLLLFNNSTTTPHATLPHKSS